MGDGLHWRNNFDLILMLTHFSAVINSVLDIPACKTPVESGIMGDVMTVLLSPTGSTP